MTHIVKQNKTIVELEGVVDLRDERADLEENIEIYESRVSDSEKELYKAKKLTLGYADAIEKMTLAQEIKLKEALQQIFE